MNDKQDAAMGAVSRLPTSVFDAFGLLEQVRVSHGCDRLTVTSVEAHSAIQTSSEFIQVRGSLVASCDSGVGTQNIDVDFTATVFSRDNVPGITRITMDEDVARIAA